MLNFPQDTVISSSDPFRVQLHRQDIHDCRKTQCVAEYIPLGRRLSDDQDMHADVWKWVQQVKESTTLGEDEQWMLCTSDYELFDHEFSKGIAAS